MSIFAFNLDKTIKKEWVFVFLFLFYCLAYVYSPYSNVFALASDRVISLIVLFVFGIYWASQASATVPIKFKFQDPWPWVVLLGLLVLVNYRPLMADIPWRGDEDYHILGTISLSHYVFSDIFLASGSIALWIFLLIFWVGRLFPKYRLSQISTVIVLVGVSLIPLMQVMIFHPQSLWGITNFATRYPLIEKWFGLLLALPGLHTEAACYRLLPFLSVIFLSRIIYHELKARTNNIIESLLFALSVVTVPVFYFYSSLLYLELPAIALATVCLFDMRSLILSKGHQLMTRPSWYCLLLSSFLKETMVVFVIIILGVRFVYQVFSMPDLKDKAKAMMLESRILFMGMAPFLIFLFFRAHFCNHESYNGQWRNVLDPANYAVVIQSLYDGLGFILITGIMGFVIGFKKDTLGSMALALLFVGTIFFYMTYKAEYIGFSRWNLFIAPIFIVTSVELLAACSRVVVTIIIVCALVYNVAFSPIHWDGERASHWGSPKSDLAEYVYPYGKAIQLLSQMHTIKRLLVVGAYYPYGGFQFYFDKFNFHPALKYLFFGSFGFDRSTERILFNKTFAHPIDADAVFYHSVNNLSLDSTIVCGGAFKLFKKLCEGDNCIYIFIKNGAI